MKRIIALVIAAILAATVFTSCSGGESAEGHTLYVYDTYRSEELTAVFLNADSSETKEVQMKNIGEDDGGVIFSCSGDPDKYDRVVISGKSGDTIQLAFNSYVSGWELSAYRVLPYTYGVENEEPTYTRVQFPYENRTKDVLIWTPDDYDANSDEKYSVIYMTDGHNLFSRSATSTGSWGVAESVTSMMSLSDNKAIIVGIENLDAYRDEELTPDLGPTSPGYEDGHGEYYSDFVYGTVAPYIEENYNVYTDPAHNAVCGSSSGGIECFYIGMEHPDKFGTIGALSPAFSLFDSVSWGKYLREKDFSADCPFVYIYNGSGDDLERYLMDGAESMPGYLREAGFPEDKVVFKSYEEGVHNELYWRAVFPDFLKYMFPQSSDGSSVTQ